MRGLPDGKPPRFLFCGSKKGGGTVQVPPCLLYTSKDLQTEAADAFFAMQAAAAKDGVDIRMQSGYRSVCLLYTSRCV